MNKLLTKRPVCLLIIFAVVFGMYGIGLLIFGNEYKMYVNFSKELTCENAEVFFGEKFKNTESEILEVKDIKIHGSYVSATVKAKTRGAEQVMLVEHSVNAEGRTVENNAALASLKVSAFRIIPENIYRNIYIVLAVFALLIFAYYTYCFVSTVKTRRYSYDAVFFLSIMLITALLNAVWVSATVYSYIQYHTSSTVLIYSLNQNLMLFLIAATLPFVLIFTASVSVSNIVLMKKEGFSPANALGIVSSIAMFAGLAALILAYYLKNGYNSHLTSVFYSVMSSLYLFFEIVLTSSIIYGIYISKKSPAYDKDFIIILGCKIKDDGTLYPLVRGRADKAIELYRKQLEATGKEAAFVPSGGKGSDEVIAEGEAIKNYLIEQGIPESIIFAETESTTTKENMLFSKKIIDSLKSDAKIAFSTTSYHVFRSGAIALANGLSIEGTGSRTKWYFWPNAFLREIAGIFTTQPKRQLIVIVLTVLAAGLGSLAYSMF